MTPARIMFFFFVAVAVLVTAYIGKKFLFATEEVPEERPPQVIQVPMAFGDLEPNTLITEEHLVTGPYGEETRRLVQERGKEPRDMIRSREKLIGRYVKKRIPKAQPLYIDDLYGPGENPELEPEAGMSAFGVSIPSSTALVNGLIRPGQFVDVIFAPSELPNEGYEGVSMTMLKGIRVLSINRNFTAGQASRGSNDVTLELTPRQVNEMTLALRKGSISLAYNPNGRDGSSYGPGGSPDWVTYRELVNLPEPPEEVEEEEPEPPKPYTTAVYRRGAVGLNAFDKETGESYREDSGRIRGRDLRNDDFNRDQVDDRLLDPNFDRSRIQNNRRGTSRGNTRTAPAPQPTVIPVPVPSAPGPQRTPSPLAPPPGPAPIMGPSFNIN